MCCDVNRGTKDIKSGLYSNDFRIFTEQNINTNLQFFKIVFHASRKQVKVLRRVCVHTLSHSVMSNSAAHWTIACQASQSLGFSRQEYWSGLPFKVYVPKIQ